MTDVERKLLAEVERLRARVAELEGQVPDDAEPSSSSLDLTGPPAPTASVLFAADQTLRESEARYRVLFENAPTGLGVADFEGRLLAFNEAMLEPGGYTREDIARIGHVAALYYDPAERDAALAIARRDGALRNHEVRLKRKDGTFYHALLSLSPIVLSGRPGWLAMVQDITQRKKFELALEQSKAELEVRVHERTANLQAANEQLQREVEFRGQIEQALRESESAWRSLMEHAPDTIITLDRAGTIMFINRTVPGYTVADTIGQSSLNYLAPEEHESFKEHLRQVFELAQPQAYETAADGAYGAPAWYQSRLGPVIRDGQVVAAILIATDITPRKQAEQALRAEQHLLRQLLRQQELDRKLVAYEIHDGIVQYITGALMRLDALAARSELTLSQVATELAPALDLLRNSIREARRLISGLRPLILDESGIGPAIEYLIGEHQAGDAPPIEFRSDLGDVRLPPALESALFRICQEALTNAVKHSGAPRVKVSLELQAGRARLTVADTGVGFDARQVSAEGFGLQGIRERTRLMGGRAEIESAPGAGTTIRVELPVEPAAHG